MLGILVGARGNKQGPVPGWALPCMPGWVGVAMLFRLVVGTSLQGQVPRRCPWHTRPSVTVTGRQADSFSTYHPFKRAATCSRLHCHVTGYTTVPRPCCHTQLCNIHCQCSVNCTQGLGMLGVLSMLGRHAPTLTSLLLLLLLQLINELSRAAAQIGRAAAQTGLLQPCTSWA